MIAIWFLFKTPCFSHTRVVKSDIHLYKRPRKCLISTLVQPGTPQVSEMAFFLLFVYFEKKLIYT